MNCWICGSEHSLQEHHVIMQANAGTAGKTVMLCSTCHDNVHKTARAMKSKNEKIRLKAYGAAEHYEKIKILAEYILRGELAYKSQLDNFRHHATAQLTISVSPAQMERLHAIKVRMGLASLESLLQETLTRMTGLRAHRKGAPPDAEPPEH